jgi:hypothetical protein
MPPPATLHYSVAGDNGSKYDDDREGAGSDGSRCCNPRGSNNPGGGNADDAPARDRVSASTRIWEKGQRRQGGTRKRGWTRRQGRAKRQGKPAKPDEPCGRRGGKTPPRGDSRSSNRKGHPRRDKARATRGRCPRVPALRDTLRMVSSHPRKKKERRQQARDRSRRGGQDTPIGARAEERNARATAKNKL